MFVAVLVASTSAVVGVGTRTADAASVTRDIHFNGYCDGLRLTIPSAGSPTTSYSVDGVVIGRPRCVSPHPVFGFAKPNHNGVFGLSRGTEFLTNAYYRNFTVIRSDHTWTYYMLNNNQLYVDNSGTWTYGSPGSSASVSSHSVHRAVPAPVATPDVALDIAFDGHCDGMSLHTPSLGLGSKGSIDGVRTGSCTTGEGVMGMKAAIVAGQSKALVVSTTDGADYVSYVIFADHTWMSAHVADGVFGPLDSGTWSTA